MSLSPFSIDSNGVVTDFDRATAGLSALSPQRINEVPYVTINPQVVAPEDDTIRADGPVPPYRGPDSLDNFGCETDAMRKAYLRLFREEPSLKSAIEGKAEAIAALDVTVQPADEDDPQAVRAAEWIDWAISGSPHGWDGLILNTLLPAFLLGWSAQEIVLDSVNPDDSVEYAHWHGLRHCRSLNTEKLRLELDAYRNVLGVVNTVRGLASYPRRKVILFTHNDLFHNPFGGADAAAAYRDANAIDNAMKLWGFAVRVYGGPFLTAKYSMKDRRQALEAALDQARQGGWMTCHKDDAVEVTNLASATSFDAFKEKIQRHEERVYMAVRGAYLPFMQGKGGDGESRGNSETSKASGSDPKEYLIAQRVCRVISRDLIPHLIRPNFPPGTGLPKVTVGGVNWQETKTQLDVAKGLKDLGLEVDPKYLFKITAMPAKPMAAVQAQQQGMPGADGAPGQQPPPGPGGGGAGGSGGPGGGPSPATPLPQGRGGQGGQTQAPDGSGIVPPELLAAMTRAAEAGDWPAVERLVSLGRHPEELAGLLGGGSAGGAGGRQAQPNSAGDDTLTFAADHQSRGEGEVWEGQGSRWFTKKSGRVVPTKNPHAEQTKPRDPAAPKRDVVAEQKAAKASREPGRQTARDAWQQATADPSKVTADHLPALAEHLRSLTRDELREMNRKLSNRLGGLKEEHVQRLLAHVGAKVAAPPAPAAGEIAGAGGAGAPGDGGNGGGAAGSPAAAKSAGKPAAVKAAAKSKGTTSPVAHIDPADPAQLKAAVTDAAARLPGVWGQSAAENTADGGKHSVLVGDVYDALKDRLPHGTSLDDFKKHLLKYNQEHVGPEVGLGRVDSPGRTPEESARIERSGIVHPLMPDAAMFHKVNVRLSPSGLAGTTAKPPHTPPSTPTPPPKRSALAVSRDPTPPATTTDINPHDPANWDALAKSGNRSKLIEAAAKLGVGDQAKRLPAGKIVGLLREKSGGAGKTRPETTPVPHDTVSTTITPTPIGTGNGRPQDATNPGTGGTAVNGADRPGSPVGTDAGSQPGRAPFRPRVVTVRGEHTKPGNPDLLPQSVTQHLSPEQQHGAALAVNALTKNGGFLNADGTGVGKTRQQLAVAKTFADQGKKVLIVSPKQVTKVDFKKGTVAGSFDNDAKAMGVPLKLTKGEEQLTPGQVHMSTYENLSKLKDKIDKNTVVLFDESHYMKNPTSARAKAGEAMADAAHSVGYFSATPGDKAVHIAHLKRAGVFGTAGKTKTFEKLGMELHDQHVGGGETRKVWRVKPGMKKEEVARRLSGLFDQMTKDGLMVKRELGMEGVGFNTDHIQLSPTQHAEVKKVYDDVLHQTDGNRAVALMAARMHQEHMKIPHTVDQVKRDLAAGRQPVVFAGRVNAVGDEGEDQHDDEVKDALDKAGHKSPGTIPALKQALIAAGVPEEHLAELHGEAKEKPEKAMDRFQSGKAKVMLATIQSGGTGVNLDDTKGDSPRSVHVMTPPLTANDMAQAIGRVHRLNTKSASNVHAVLSDTDIDRWNAGILHDKFRSLGAIGGGQITRGGELVGAAPTHEQPDAEPFDWGESLHDTRHYHDTPAFHNELIGKFGGSRVRRDGEFTTQFPSKEHFDRYRQAADERDAAFRAKKEAETKAAANRQPQHHGGRGHSFTQLKNGNWGARIAGNSEEGDTAVLTTKRGDTKHVKLGRKVWSGNGVTLHEIK